MALSDKFKDLKSKAEEAVVERKDQIQQVVQKAGAVADERTGGKYHDKIEQAGDKALGYMNSLGEPDPAAPAQPGAPGESVNPSAGGHSAPGDEGTSAGGA